MSMLLILCRSRFMTNSGHVVPGALPPVAASPAVDRIPRIGTAPIPRILYNPKQDFLGIFLETVLTSTASFEEFCRTWNPDEYLITSICIITYRNFPDATHPHILTIGQALFRRGKSSLGLFTDFLSAPPTSTISLSSLFCLIRFSHRPPPMITGRIRLKAKEG
ncbi:hypothetical protein J6590_027191 [Homalodisca vitripennis]|nr:hypothetical protein J6590_027191 [Homalodisca vitripennis]